MLRAIRLASSAEDAPSMASSITCPAPSPSSMTCRAREPQIFRSARENAVGRLFLRRMRNRDAASSTGQQQHSVVGGSVAVDRDAVERGLDGLIQESLEFSRVDLRVCKDVHQHGCVGDQLRSDHAGTLGDTKQMDLLVADVDLEDWRSSPACPWLKSPPQIAARARSFRQAASLSEEVRRPAFQQAAAHQ